MRAFAELLVDKRHWNKLIHQTEFDPDCMQLTCQILHFHRTRERVMPRSLFTFSWP
jgi:hypothetical protein